MKKLVYLDAFKKNSGQKLILIIDKFSSHKSEEIEKYFKKQCRNLFSTH